MFDLFNTLYRFDPERETTQINAAKLIGIEITNAKIVSALNKADKWFAKKTSEISLHLMNDKEKDLFYSNYEKILFNFNFDIYFNKIFCKRARPWNAQNNFS